MPAKMTQMSPDSRCYFLLRVEDSLIIDRNARQHNGFMAQPCDMKDTDTPAMWCGIKFTFLDDKMFLHEKTHRRGEIPLAPQPPNTLT